MTNWGPDGMTAALNLETLKEATRPTERSPSAEGKSKICRAGPRSSTDEREETTLGARSELTVRTFLLIAVKEQSGGVAKAGL